MDKLKSHINGKTVFHPRHRRIENRLGKASRYQNFV